MQPKRPRINPLILALALAAVLMVWSVMGSGSGSTSGSTMSYSTVVHYFEHNQVTAFTLDRNTSVITLNLKEGDLPLPDVSSTQSTVQSTGGLLSGMFSSSSGSTGAVQEDDGTVTIAAYSSIATHWLPAVIRDFQENYPHVEIKLMEGIWQEVSQWLEERTADIGFLSYQENMPFEWIPLAEDPMLALLPRDHPLAGADCYPLKRCEQDSFIMPALGCDDDVEALFARNHVDPNIRYTTIENFSAMSMVEQGLGVSVMNKLITEKRICDVAMIPIDPPASITLGAALHSRADASPAVKMFLKYAVRMLTKSAV